MRYSLKLLLAVLVTFPITIIVILVSLFEREGKLGYSISRFWASAILKIGGIRLKVRGLERLDPRRQYIFMVNHQSILDIPVLVQSLPYFQLRWIAKKELFLIPFFGWALWASRHIVVDRSNRSKAIASLRKAKERISQGISVVVFPEGTRSRDGKFRPFKRGGFLLAVQTQTPIAPVTINGSGTLLPKGDLRIRGGEIEVIVSEPVPPEMYRSRNTRALLSHIREIMESHSRKQVESFNNVSNNKQALAEASRPMTQG